MKLLRKFKYKVKYFVSPLPSPEKWLFLVGCSNSGTTLLHTILSKHPEIGSLPDEGQFCTNQLPLGRNHGPKRLWAIPPKKLYLDEDGGKDINVYKIKKQWGARFNDLTKPILMEKSPPNTVRLRWLQSNFPPAYFIGIIRNGYAVAEGIKRKIGHPVELGAKQWANSNEILLNDFQKIKNGLLISYENLTEHPEETLKTICEFIGISNFEKDFFSETFRIHGKSGQIKNQNYLSFNNLSKEECLLIEREALFMLDKLNYLGKR